MTRSIAILALVAALFTPTFAADAPPAPAGGGGEAPKIFWDKAPRIVAYQLKQLSNAQLLAVERNTTDAKYKPGYEAILTRKGMERKARQEALDSLIKLNKSDAVLELLNGVDMADSEDKGTPRELIAMLMAQKPEALAKSRGKLAEVVSTSDKDLLKQAAYAAMAAADGKPDQVWKTAEDKEGLKLLLGGVPLIVDAKTREAFHNQIKPLVAKAPDDPTRIAAIESISATGHEADVFAMLSNLVKSEQGDARDAAVRSIRRIPVAKWPAAQVEPLAMLIIDWVKKTPGADRTSPGMLQAVQLGNDLAAALPPAKGLPIRKTLRELAVRVVVIRTLREQMQYDLRYFIVQTGKPVQIMLDNGDAMPHNFVITAPGAMTEIATAAAALPQPTDYVPNSPKVIKATTLVQPDESATLSLNAPAKAGEYPFVCTFPGHSERMYGVMLVVDDIDAWEAAPKAPTDPLTKKPFDKQHNEAGEPVAHHEH